MYVLDFYQPQGIARKEEREARPIVGITHHQPLLLPLQRNKATYYRPKQWAEL